MNPEMVTRLLFNDTAILEISSDDDAAMMSISSVGDSDPADRSVNLCADEIDLVIAALTLYKKRLETKKE